MIKEGDEVEVLVADNPYHEVGDVLPVWGVDPDRGIKLPDASGGAVWYDPSQLKLAPKETKPKWELITEVLATGEGENTSATEMAGGCLVRSTSWAEECKTESSVFVPNSHVQNGFVVSRPERIQVSETQNILIAEVAALSKRAETLIFTLRCGKEISVTDEDGSVLNTFMQVSP